MKKYLFLLFAGVLALGFSAFVTKDSNQKESIKKGAYTTQWFDFTGTSSSQYSNPAYYTADPNHQNPCSGTGLRCEILAPVRTDAGHVGEPDLTAIEQETKKP
jgi:hypothetical protein